MTASLSPEDRDRLETLFARAVDLPRTEHAEFIARECGRDGALREELARLLGALDGEDHLTRLGPGAALRAGSLIGTYRLLERVGEGGMGEVYAAEQLEPVRRRVALKLIKPGMDSGQVVARFDAERHALARMTHANIAQVYDAGMTVDGRSYFVMELVRGVSITEYCDHRRLSTRRRLELFLQVCAGVQHAHQKGIIHRDLKPSNLLAMEQDGGAVVKIIDFGVARATTGRLSEHTLYTMAGQIIGTLDYMSPEQADPTALDIDTRSDVYSLGVVLYELVTGALPFARHERRKTGFQEVLRRITEDEPPKPSTRLAGSDTEAAARNRRSDTRTLLRELRGDLDWIALKALEKDPARRYATASEFAADVRRHLADETVSAGRPGLRHRTGKFVRRNRVAVSAGLAVTIGIVAGLYGIVSSLAADRLAEAQRPYADAHRLRRLERRADEDLWPPHPDKIQALRLWLADARGLAGTLESHERDLQAMQQRGATSATAAARQAALAELIVRLRALSDEATGLLGENAASPEHGWSVPRRLRFAEDLEAGFAPGGKYARVWNEKLPEFREVCPELAEPQMGLVPIGEDPDSPHFLFAHLMTGAPAKLTGGRIELTDDTGVVLILLPRDEFLMGAQATDPDRPNFDRGAWIAEGPVRKVTLSAHFLSKYEMTQGQWQTLTGDNPSRYGPHHEWNPRWLASGDAPSLLHPVEQVSWWECDLWLRNTGLSLPTEAQWEHGTRAGTSTRFWTGDDLSTLQVAANLSDNYAKDHGGEEHQRPPTRSTYEDGSTMHAPVNSYRPNAFGLYNVHGNVFEWCLDGYVWSTPTDAPTPGVDPVVFGDGHQSRVYRGGCYRWGPGAARSSARSFYPPGMKGHALGVRPARSIIRRGRSGG